MSTAPARTVVQNPLAPPLARRIAVRLAGFACVVAVTVLTSEASDWRPVSLVLALGAALIAADAASVAARRIRISSGLMVQTTIMALLGPGPAVLAATASTLVETRLHKIRVLATLNNLVLFGVLGLIGGLMFELLAESLGIDRRDTAYAVLTLPCYVVLS